MEKVPEIRFESYQDSWNQIKAKEIFNSISVKNRPDLPVLSATQDMGVVYRDSVGIDIKFDESTVTSYKKVSPGQFVIHLRSFQGGLAYSEIEGIISPAYTIIEVIDTEKDKHDKHFWKHYFTSERFIQSLKRVTFGIRDGRAISFAGFSSVRLPVTVKGEQSGIGRLLDELDSLINLQEQKIEHLEDMKQTMLSKMFPKKGEDRPEIRFEGFDEPWRRKAVKAFLLETDERTAENNQYAVISSTAKGLFWQDDYFQKQVASENNIGYKVLRKRSIVFSPQNLWLGNLNYNDKFEIGIVSPSYKTFEIKEGYSESFVAQLLKRPESFYEYASISEQGASVVRRNISTSDFLTLEFLFPAFEEQRLVGILFTNLDSTIAVEERKFEALRKIKESLLQKMFV